MNPLTLTDYEAHIDRKIEEARRRGDFDNLPGSGRPLALDDDALVPEELRVATRILKNAGYVPPEVEHLSAVNQLIAAVERQELGDSERAAATRRLRVLLAQIEAAGRPATAQRAWVDYNAALLRRVDRT